MKEAAPLLARPANPEDIIVDRRFWLLGDEGIHRIQVDYVLRPADLWKAFVATDGCRYGLDGLFVQTSDGPFCPGCGDPMADGDVSCGDCVDWNPRTVQKDQEPTPCRCPGHAGTGAMEEHDGLCGMCSHGNHDDPRCPGVQKDQEGSS